MSSQPTFISHETAASTSLTSTNSNINITEIGEHIYGDQGEITPADSGTFDYIQKSQGGTKLPWQETTSSNISAKTWENSCISQISAPESDEFQPDRPKRSTRAPQRFGQEINPKPISAKRKRQYNKRQQNWSSEVRDSSMRSAKRAKKDTGSQNRSTSTVNFPNLPPLKNRRGTHLKPISLSSKSCDDQGSAPSKLISNNEVSQEEQNREILDDPEQLLAQDVNLERDEDEASAANAVTPMRALYCTIRAVLQEEDSTWSIYDLTLNKKYVSTTSLVVKLRLGANSLKHEEEKNRMLDLSRRLSLGTELLDKPAARCQPAVWATDRQSLCETLPYYRSYQGSCYMKDGIVRAMMLDENGHASDFMDEDVIISRAGGGMARDKLGSLIQVKGQVENAQSRSMRNNMSQEIPIIIICGDKNALCPSKMPHRYCVLGFFKITDIVSSKGRRKKQDIIQYRFEKLNPDQAGWWGPLYSEPVVRLGELAYPMSRKCNACKVTHEQVFLEWVCLTPECRAYWKLLDGTDPRGIDMENFNPCWLKKRTRWNNERDPFDISPTTPDMCYDQMVVAYPHGSTQGICCPRCGRCNSRYKYEGWICGDDGHICDFTHMPRPTVASLQVPRDPARAVGTGSPISYDSAQSHVQLRQHYQLNHRINSFQFADLDDDIIIHMIANRRALEEPRGPDDMFKAMQEADIGLERRLMVTGKAFGRMSAFSVNHGYPYKFVATPASRPFDEAPWVIRETRTQLNFFSKLVLCEKFPERSFNELLTFGYLEGQMIKYHDDGELGLGPTVATFSLGAPAEMRFRMKGKYYTGVLMKTRDGKEVEDREDEEEDQGKTPGGRQKIPYFVTDPPLPGSEKYEARKKAIESLQGLSHEERDARCWALPHELGLKYKKGSAPMVSLYLAHGDKIIMHGEAIQKYFEHQVEPIKGHGIRFANTCREILPHHLPESMRPANPVCPDTGIYNGKGLQG